MNAIPIPLYNKFYQAVQGDLNAARTLTEASQFPQALYHLQQAFEKCVKSMYIFQETRHNNTPEATIMVLRRMAEIDNRRFEDQLLNVTDPRLVQLRQALRNSLDGYNRALDRMVTRLDLQNNFESNIRNYENFVRARYNEYQTSINEILSTQPDQGFLFRLLAMSLLYPCVYKMNGATRYPLAQFNYNNLDLLSNTGQACADIIEIMADLFSLLRSDLEFPQAQTNPTTRQAV